MFRFNPQAASVPAADVSMNSRRRMKSYLPLIMGVIGRRVAGSVTPSGSLSITVSLCDESSGVLKKDSRRVASAIQSSGRQRADFAFFECCEFDLAPVGADLTGS
jgi:hypothetical protein